MAVWSQDGDAAVFQEAGGREISEGNIVKKPAFFCPASDGDELRCVTAFTHARKPFIRPVDKAAAWKSRGAV